MKSLPARLLHTDLSHRAGENQRLHPQRAQRIFQVGAVERPVAVLVHHNITGLGVKLVNHIGALQGAVNIGVIAPVPTPAGQGWRLQLGRPLPHQRPLWPGQKAGVDDGNSRLAAKGNQLLVLRNGGAGVGHLHRRALAHKIVLHVYNQQGRITPGISRHIPSVNNYAPRTTQRGA